MTTDLETYTRTTAANAQQAARELAVRTGQQKNDWLIHLAGSIRTHAADILAANAIDISAAQDNGLTTAMVDRLRLSNDRLESIAAAVEEIVALPDPIGEVIESTVRPNGIRVTKQRVPLGVVFFIYESRPNVTIDAAALCVKSGNAVILRGGKEAFHSNTAFHKVIAESLSKSGLPQHAVQLVETTDRAAVGQFLKLDEYISVTIPRGGRSLIERVTSEATMPVIKHFDGICHVYVDRAADFDMAEEIIINSKCHRPGVCNAAETLLIHKDIADEFAPRVAVALQQNGVQLRGCSRTQEIIADCTAATDEDFATEYLDLILSIRIVDNIDTAIEHITKFGSAHTDAIVTRDISAAEQFTARVDSAAVVVNASTRFNDGGEFGLGAEIGISTDRFHARGPCGLREITTYKYVVQGNGQIR